MEQRIARLRALLKEQDLDGLFVVQPENRTYISGFTGSSAYLLITANHLELITDFRYLDQARDECKGYEIVPQGASLLAALEAEIRKLNLKRVGFEQEFLTYGEVLRYQALSQKINGFHFVPTAGLFEALRVVKDEAEIQLIKHAAKIADDAFSHILGFLRPGLTEQEVALELETCMRKHGASGPSFTTIIASGWRSSLPHGVASPKVLETGDFVKLDFGALYEGYCSDLTRTVVLGEPSSKQREVYNIVLEAQRLALNAAKVGMTGSELDGVARRHIAKCGYDGAFGHSLGHGIGLAIHEAPRIAATSDDVLSAGMVITVEPGIYLTKWGGVRIEDDVLLLPDGKEILTHAPKDELIVVK